MKIIVCIKQVPDTTDVRINPETNTLIREGVASIINPFDLYAIEEAVRIKEALGGTVTVVTLGDEDSEDVLRRALAMGADDAILIDEEGFEASDATGIARGLNRALRDLSFDLVLTGVKRADDGWCQVGLFLAELLNLPYASMAVGVLSMRGGGGCGWLGGSRGR